MSQRGLKERKLVALMVNDLKAAELDESQMNTLVSEVAGMSEAELDRTLTSRLGLPHDADEKTLENSLEQVEEPERISGGAEGGFTRAPDMSHGPRPDEREGG